MNHPRESTHEDPVAALAERIEGIDIAMLTTIGDDLRLHTRPMATQEIADDGGLWFFASSQAPVVINIRQRAEVNLAYVSGQRYVSVVGLAEVRHDPAKIRELWTPSMSIWFPKGVDDPDLVLIRVAVDEADYWNGATGMLERLTGFIREMLGGKPAVDKNEAGRGHLDLRT